jgi:isopentenyl diphosphate isomerase/L-lactate dehydrogenase-like FMN-dependent dehydrogenase
MPRYENYPAAIRSRVTAIPKGEVRVKMKNESLNWDDLRALRERWPRTLIVKGILHADDARRAVDLGADAVVVSNHGARNLDATPAPIDVLPEIVDAVGSRTTVIVDGGFRRGSDVVKGIALGAKAVLVGRGTLYGTAAGGEAGAARALELYREEIDRVMALVGARTLADLGPQYLHFMDRVR